MDLVIKKIVLLQETGIKKAFGNSEATFAGIPSAQHV